MTTKEALKKAIDKLSDKEAKKLYQYLVEMKAVQQEKQQRNIPSFKLKGALDNKDVRSLANE